MGLVSPVWVVVAFLGGFALGGLALFWAAARGVDAEEHYREVRGMVLGVERGETPQEWSTQETS